MVKAVLFSVSLGLAAGMYVPLFSRILRRRHTRDFSKAFCGLLLLVQVVNFALAISERAFYLTMWYALQILLTAGQLWLVYRFWDSPEPKWAIYGPPRKQPRHW